MELASHTILDLCEQLQHLIVVPSVMRVLTPALANLQRQHWMTKRIEVLIGQLAAEDFELRESAKKSLKDAGEPILQTLLVSRKIAKDKEQQSNLDAVISSHPVRLEQAAVGHAQRVLAMDGRQIRDDLRNKLESLPDFARSSFGKKRAAWPTSRRTPQWQDANLRAE